MCCLLPATPADLLRDVPDLTGRWLGSSESEPATPAAGAPAVGRGRRTEPALRIAAVV